MQRLRVYDVRVDGRLGNAVGICQSDVKGYCSFLNASQRRLLYAKEASEESWWGTWAEIAFTVTRAVPFFTAPREVARLELVDVCNRPVAVQNQFFEFLRFGNGHLPKFFCQQNRGCFHPQVLSRNNVPTFTDLTSPPQYIRIYPTDAADVNKGVVMQGTDSNNNVIYSQLGLNRITGTTVYLDQPFVTVALSGSTAPLPFNSITGIQKDATVGVVRFTQVDPTTGKRKQGITAIVSNKGQHSVKPEAMRQMIEVVSYPPYLELFARQTSEGWTTWGNEVAQARRVSCGQKGDENGNRRTVERHLC